MATLMLDLSDVGRLTAEYQSAMENGGLRVSSPVTLEPREEVRIDVLLPKGETVSVMATVAAPIPGRSGEFAVRLKESNASRLLLSRARKHAQVGKVAPNEVATRELQTDHEYRYTISREPTETQAVRGRGRPSHELWTTPPLGDVRALPIEQRKQRAISGGPDERAVLFHDKDNSLQIWVLKNPTLSLPEALRFSSHADLTVEAIRFLATNKRWGKEPDIVRNLGINPATPPDALLRMLRGLPSEKLDKLLEDPMVRDRFSALLRPGGGSPRG